MPIRLWVRGAAVLVVLVTAGLNASEAEDKAVKEQDHD